MSMKKVVNQLIPIMGWSIYGIYRFWCSSLRYTECNRQAIESITDHGRSVVLCLWHDELFPLIYLKRQLKIIAIVSKSRDGDLLARVLQYMGLETARGSSSRGGVDALRATLKRMHDGLCACITVDGPKGPRHKAKKGAIFLAQQAKAPIVPVRIFMNQTKQFNSWDRFQLPIPFSKIRMVCGDAYYVTSSLTTQEEIRHECHKLEDCLNRLE